MAEYILYYWPINFRGNKISCVFTYFNISYEGAPVSELLRLKNMDISTYSENSPLCMAPPMLYDKEYDIFISQTTAIIAHISRKHHLGPMLANGVDSVGTPDLKKQVIGEKIIADCNDFIDELTSHCGFTMWEKDEFMQFMEPKGRFVKWLLIIEQTGHRYGLTETSYYLGTPVATSADIVIYATFKSLLNAFPEFNEIIKTFMPNVMNLVDRLHQNNRLNSLMASKPPRPYCGGLIEKSLIEMVSVWSKDGTSANK